MACKVCGSKGPMKKNLRGRDTDTCVECQKKYKRLQHLHHVLPLDKIKDKQVAEHNELVKLLANKTALPLIISGPNGWEHDKVSRELRVSTTTFSVPISSHSANEAFALYADAIPRKVIYNQDKRFSGSKGEQERIDYPVDYEGSLQYLFDMLALSKNDTKQLLFDKDLWSGNLAAFTMDNSDILSMENVEPEHMYHWLCFIYATIERTIQDGNSIQGNVDDYLLYSVDEISGNIVVK